MQINTLIIGAGAAGLMCAAHAGPSTLLIDHAKAPGEKIRISGGGRCNFTNLHTSPENFLSQNPHFCKSALKRYTQWDFLDLVARYKIAYHEKTLGQLFCDETAKDIIQMLLSEMRAVGADLWLKTSVTEIEKTDTGFRVSLERNGQNQCIETNNVVIASGGKSIPKMGASGFGYRIATQFGLPLVETRPGLVPLTFGDDLMALLKPLAGLACPSLISANGTGFEEAMLITHRGLSGPAILQVSSYWSERETIVINLLPGQNALDALKSLRKTAGARAISTCLSDLLPKRLAQFVSERANLPGNFADQSDTDLTHLAQHLSAWDVQPTGTEGYRTAEVTLGGVSTDALNSKTMQAKDVPGLYFIGEVVDVTGWLGGYNFQWAWSSGWAAGRAISAG